MSGTCRICDEPATRSIGDYAFCDLHFERATRERRGGWQADVASIVLLVAFVVVLYAIDSLVQPQLSGTALTVIGLVIAIVPAVVWLGFFYRRDRLEPEPRTMVVGEFVLGALVATAIAIPLVDQLFDVGSWLFTSPLVHLAGGILVVGFAQEGLKYLTIRLSVYDSREFDERTDGIIYGTAVGLGFATALNVAFVVDSGGVDLGTGAIRIVLTSLAHASFGGVIGYFLGTPEVRAAADLVDAGRRGPCGRLNGTFFFLRSTVGRGHDRGPARRDRAVDRAGPRRGPCRGRDGRPVHPHPAGTGAGQRRGRRRSGGLVVTAAVAASPRAARDRRELQSFVAVIVVVLVAIAAGLLIRNNVERATQQVDAGGLNAELPAGWIVLPAAGDRLLTAYDPLDPDLRYGVAAIDAAAGGTVTPEDAAARRIADRANLLEAFKVSSEGPGALGSVPTYEVRYTFVDHAPGGQTTAIEAIEHYFADGALFPEDRVLAVIVEAPPDKLEAALPDFDRFARQIAGRAGTAAVPGPVLGRALGGPQLASVGDPTEGAPTDPGRCVRPRQRHGPDPDGRDDRRAGAGLRLGLRHDHHARRTHPHERPCGHALGGRSRRVRRWTRRRKSIPRTWSSLSSSRRTSRLCRSTARASSRRTATSTPPSSRSIVTLPGGRSRAPR